jgi:hypothetical protein
MVEASDVPIVQRSQRNYLQRRFRDDSAHQAPGTIRSRASSPRRPTKLEQRAHLRSLCERFDALEVRLYRAGSEIKREKTTRSGSQRPLVIAILTSRSRRGTDEMRALVLGCNQSPSSFELTYRYRSTPNDADRHYTVCSEISSRVIRRQT